MRRAPEIVLAVLLAALLASCSGPERKFGTTYATPPGWVESRGVDHGYGPDTLVGFGEAELGKNRYAAREKALNRAHAAIVGQLHSRVDSEFSREIESVIDDVRGGGKVESFESIRVVSEGVVAGQRKLATWEGNGNAYALVAVTRLTLLEFVQSRSRQLGRTLEGQLQRARMMIPQHQYGQARELLNLTNAREFDQLQLMLSALGDRGDRVATSYHAEFSETLAQLEESETRESTLRVYRSGLVSLRERLTNARRLENEGKLDEALSQLDSTIISRSRELFQRAEINGVDLTSLDWQHVLRQMEDQREILRLKMSE